MGKLLAGREDLPNLEVFRLGAAWELGKFVAGREDLPNLEDFWLVVTSGLGKFVAVDGKTKLVSNHSKKYSSIILLNFIESLGYFSVSYVVIKFTVGMMSCLAYCSNFR